MTSFPPRSVLVPVDLSETSMAALRYARLFHEQLGASVTVLHAERLEVPPYFTQSQEAELLDVARKARRRAVEEVARASAEVLGFRPEVRIEEGYPSAVILDAVARGAYDLIVLGTHGRRGPSRLWLGSVTERVIRASSVPVLAVRDGASASGIQRVFCPVTAGEASALALGYAVSVAEAFSAELHVLRAVGGAPGALPECPEVTDDLRARCEVVEKTVEGSPADAFVAGAREAKADLVVIAGEHPDSLFGELFSTTSDQILRRMAIPLVVVPPDSRHEES